MPELRAQLAQGLDALGIDADARQLDQLFVYLELLRKWNKTFNLTAITDPVRMVTHHLLDSLAIIDAIPEQGCCLDVGSGAGLPGLPLAVLLPRTRWVLLDSNGKKTRFMQQAVAQCGLPHVEVVHARVQDYHAALPFDIIVTRAFASLNDLVSSVEHLWQPRTALISMKGAPGEAELRALDSSRYSLRVQQLQVPGIAEERSLVWIQRR